MLYRNLRLIFHKEASCYRTWSILTKTMNQSSKSYVTVSSRLVYDVFPKHCNKMPPTRKDNMTRFRWDQRKCLATDSGKLVPIFLQPLEKWNKTAVVSQHGSYTYNDLLHYSADLAREIEHVSQNIVPKPKQGSLFSLKGQRVAFLCENDMSYVVTLMAVWMCGGVAVPLCKTHPVPELEYFIENSGAKLIISTDDYADKLSSIAAEHGLVHKVLHKDDYSGDFEEDSRNKFLVNAEHFLDLGPRKWHIDKDRNALIVYTSGTTGRPKGVVHTFGSIRAQIEGMVDEWGWSQDDVVLHVLPLHHVHGIVNVLLTSLFCGATCVIKKKFKALDTWHSLLSTKAIPSVNLFMAVPTVYAKLMEAHTQQQEMGDKQLPDDIKDILGKKIRLMVSGSAALPQPIMKRWAELTGHTLLERYGMTETGMVLTNPLIGQRIPGAVGKPFPGVSVCIANFQEDKKEHVTVVTSDSNETAVTPGTEGQSGELWVKGDNLFKEYWNNQKATLDAYTTDGWFKTGDTAVYEDNAFKIVGRTSVDVIKSGGYKISALDIERHLLEHPDIRDIAVLGLPDETWGQVVAAVVIPKTGCQIDLEQVKAWAAERMPPYQVPRVCQLLEEMPRNAMGKVNKKELAKTVFPEYL